MGIRIFRCSKCGYLEGVDIIEEVPMVVRPRHMIATEDGYKCIICLEKERGNPINCDNCIHYHWYYDYCDKWECEVDAREIHDACFEKRFKRRKSNEYDT